MIGFPNGFMATLCRNAAIKERTTIGILIVDDSPGARRQMRSIVSGIVESHFKGITCTIDEFESRRDYETGAKPSYDLCIIDWNLGSSAGDNGDSVVDSIIAAGRCHDITIWSGMDDDSPMISRFTVERTGVSYISKGDRKTGDKLLERIARVIG